MNATIFNLSTILLIHFLVLIVIKTSIVLFFPFSRLVDPSRQMWYDLDIVNSLSKTTIEKLDCFQLDNIQQTYQYMYPLINFDNTIVSSSFHKATEVSVAGDIFGSLMSRNFRSSDVVAYWAKADGRIREYNDMGLTPKPGVIKYFVKHCLMVGDQSYTNWFAYCDWFLSTPENIRNMFGKPVEVWYQNLFQPTGPASFVAVARILAKFVHVTFSHRSLDIMAVAPRLKQSCF